MAYPRGWRQIKGDSGTASAAFFGRSHTYVGYLNLTPRQGAETLANWTQFRLNHNADEGDRSVRPLAATTGRALGAQTVSCVMDSYTTESRSDYTEIACLVKGPRATVVAVGASPPEAFTTVAPLLERAIESTRA